MKSTSNYKLPTYEAADIANLTDGYNSAMSILDTNLKTVSNQATTNKTNIAAETTRAKAAEATLTTALDGKLDKGAAPAGTYAVYANGTAVFTPSAS